MKIGDRKKENEEKTMKIYLMNNHEAVVVNDHGETVCVEPAVDGVLVVNGRAYAVTSGRTETPRMSEPGGIVKAYFQDKRGIRYGVITPRVDQGNLYTAVDFAGGYVDMRLLIDRQAREIERLTRELLDLRGQIQPDALGHMNIGGEENE